MSQSLARDLRKLLGTEVVKDQPRVLQAHSGDKWFAAAMPEAVVLARRTEEVVKLLRYAERHGVPVTPRGAGVGYVGGCVPVKGGVALSLARMRRIKSLSPKDGVAVVEPGVITGHLQRKARETGFYYPPDPASLNECSIGGNIATNAGGPRCLKYGVTRHYVLGLEVVLAGGRVLRTGSRTHKNKTGFDLAGLFVGSEGLLGVVTEATLKLIPHPPERMALSVGFPSTAMAAEAVQKIFTSGFLPSAVEIADRFTLQAARQYLGTRKVPSGDAHLMVELDGQAGAVRSDLNALKAILQTLQPASLRVAGSEAECERFWKLRREFSYSLRATGLTKLNEDIVIPRGRLVDLMRFAEDLQRRHGYPVACFGHAGDGNIHVNVMVEGYDRPEVRRRVRKVLDQLFERILKWGGVITGEHGIGLAKKPWWKQAVHVEARAVHQDLKRALDPKGILNPAKFLS